MKVTFEFDTDNENFCQDELERFYRAFDMAQCIYEISNKLRGWYKYDSRSEIPIEEVHEEIWNIINEHVNLDKIWS